MSTPSGVGPRPSRSAPRDAGVRPPDEAQRWTAEIQWRPSGEEARFCVVARDQPADEGTVVARSEPLDWPPADSRAVQALVDAADALTEGLLTAGWKPLPQGRAWYERRFEWEPGEREPFAPPGARERIAPPDEPEPVATRGQPEPVATRGQPKPVATPDEPEPVATRGQPKPVATSDEPEPVATPGEWAPPAAPRSAPPARAPAPGARVRKRPWPRGSDALWRCEIKWSPGYTRSRFEAVAHDPERRNDRVVGASTSFKWMLMADPDPGGKTFRDEVRGLAGALEGAGWERLGPAGPWYAERFVWRRDEPPPDHVELAPAETDPAP